MREHSDGDRQRRETRFAKILMRWVDKEPSGAWTCQTPVEEQNAEEWGAAGFDVILNNSGARFRVTVEEIDE